jgi:rhodanese-related sulfurtransferase
MFIGFKRNLSAIIFVILLVPGFTTVNGWSADKSSYQNISLVQFIKMFEQKDFILINVHIPYQGEIPGTDLLIPFNKIHQAGDEMPMDRDKKIVVYCMAGPMGYYAADKLAAMGYTRVMHFEQGMKAWYRSGRPLENRKN